MSSVTFEDDSDGRNVRSGSEGGGSGSAGLDSAGGGSDIPSEAATRGDSAPPSEFSGDTEDISLVN